MNFILGLIITVFILVFLISMTFTLDEKGRPLKDRVFYFVVAVVFALALSVLFSMTGVLRVW